MLYVGRTIHTDFSHGFVHNDENKYVFCYWRVQKSIKKNKCKFIYTEKSVTMKNYTFNDLDSIDLRTVAGSSIFSERYYENKLQIINYISCFERYGSSNNEWFSTFLKNRIHEYFFT